MYSESRNDNIHIFLAFFLNHDYDMDFNEASCICFQKSSCICIHPFIQRLLKVRLNIYLCMSLFK